MSFLCKLVRALLKNHLFTKSQPILQITDKMRCIDVCYEGQQTIVDMITCVYDSLICKLVPPLLRYPLFRLDYLFSSCRRYLTYWMCVFCNSFVTFLPNPVVIVFLFAVWKFLICYYCIL